MSLAAFRVRSFRFQWPADLLTAWAFEMENIVLGWYVMVSTGSVLLLTIFGSLQFLGTLVAPSFGVLGDRVGGRAMLCVLRMIYLVLAAAVVALAFAGVLTPVAVFALAALNGIVRPSDLVMRNAVIGETIPAGELMGAIGLSRASTDAARVAGALTGAGLSAWLGIGPAYVGVAACYAVSLALTFGIARSRAAPDPAAPARRETRSQLRELRDGVRHVVSTPRLLAMMWLAFLINMTAYPASNGLLPYAARHVYRVDATGLGWLVASFAIGGLAGSIVMVATGGSRHPERPMLVFTAIWYAVLLAFAHVETLAAAVVLLGVAGFVQNVALVSMTVSLLGAAGEQYRGRVMGVRTLAVYGLPIGLVSAGALIERLGYPLTLSLTSLVGLGGTVLIGLRWRDSIWREARRPAQLPVA